ncbi:MAG: hypothetical protein E7378_04485 [Clostridiales bacterium]|nr:hypothetical protein [Clostridiales bacterium]
MKKFLTCLLALILLIPTGFLLGGCGGNQNKVMNVSLNPELEFILNGNNKVVSVNALNDEGNRIVASATFVGLDANAAVNLFIEKTKDEGYLIQGSANINQNNLNIEISGNSAKALYDSVKESAEEYLDGLSVEIGINFSNNTLSKYDLIEKVSECMKEYSAEQLEKMNEGELINLLKQSRDETREMFTQELKELYYDLRLNEIREAKFEELINIIEEKGNLLAQTFATMAEEYLSTLQDTVAEIKEQFADLYLQAGAAFDVAMNNFVEAKEEFLDANLSGVLTPEQVAEYKENIESFENALETAKTSAKNAMATFDHAINTTLAQLEDVLESVANMLSNVNLEAKLKTAMNNASKNFNASFKAEFNAELNTTHWGQN